MRCLLTGNFLIFIYIITPFFSFGQSAKPTAPGYEVKQSELLTGIQWLGEEIPYGDTSKRGDTFPLTWASDNNVYTSAGDPLWGKKPDGLDFEIITGNPDNYAIDKINEMSDYFGWGGCGAKPTGLICIKNILYLAFQNMTGMQTKTDLAAAEVNHGYDASIIYSEDYGKTWLPDIRMNKTPMFPGRIFAAPAFINYGKNNAGATDGFVYAMSGEGWCNGNHIRLGRVPADSIMKTGAWEWISGFSSDFLPLWTKN